MKVLISVITLLSTSALLVAQTVTLHGTVTDESAAIVQGATITLTNRPESPRPAATGNDGSYSMTGIATGEYAAQASAPDVKAEAIKVAVGTGDQTLNFSLKVALVTQEVTVDEQMPTVSLDPASNASATVLKAEDLEALSITQNDRRDSKRDYAK